MIPIHPSTGLTRKFQNNTKLPVNLKQSTITWICSVDFLLLNVDDGPNSGLKIGEAWLAILMNNYYQINTVSYKKILFLFLGVEGKNFGTIRIEERFHVKCHMFGDDSNPLTRSPCHITRNDQLQAFHLFLSFSVEY